MAGMNTQFEKWKSEPSIYIILTSSEVTRYCNMGNLVVLYFCELIQLQFNILVEINPYIKCISKYLKHFIHQFRLLWMYQLSHRTNLLEFDKYYKRLTTVELSLFVEDQCCSWILPLTMNLHPFQNILMFKIIWRVHVK